MRASHSNEMVTSPAYLANDSMSFLVITFRWLAITAEDEDLVIFFKISEYFQIFSLYPSRYLWMLKGADLAIVLDNVTDFIKKEPVESCEE